MKFQFFNTLKQLFTNDAVSFSIAFTRYIKWQCSKLAGSFPTKIFLSDNSILYTDKPNGVSSLTYFFGMYDYHNMSLVKLVLLNDKALGFIDVGANIGTYTLIASEVTSKVVSFEPHPKTFELLESNVILNERKNVHLINKAVSNKRNFVQFTDLDENSINRIDRNGFLKVPCVDLDSVLDKSELTKFLLKVDVEGSELEVLEGLNNNIDECKLMIIEGGTRKEIINKIQSEFDFIGPKYFNTNKKEFSSTPQRRQEDEIFIAKDFLKDLLKFGLRIADN